MPYATCRVASSPLAVGRRRLSAALGAFLILALAACNGTAVVTLTSTASTDTFLAYRVGLVSIQLQTSNGKTTVTALPKSTTVDLARLVNLSDVVGAAAVAQGNFTQAVVTIDYSAAQIIYDNNTIDGIALTPVASNGAAVGEVTLTLDLDPSNQMRITRGSAARLSLDFNLAASNVVNLAQKTVTVMPMMAASASPIDTKVVRVRGPISSVNTTDTVFSNGIVPFDFGTAGAGSLQITPSTVTTYEINGAPSVGTAGLTQLAALKSGTMSESFGALTATTSTSTDDDTADEATTTTTCADGSTPTTSLSGTLVCANGATPTTTTTPATTTSTTSTNISFAATQVLAGSSVEGSGFDRISGIVSGRSGNTLTVEDATLLSDAGANTFIPGTTVVSVGANTQVTEFGDGSAETNGLQQISVGSRIFAFGTANTPSSTTATLDASAGHVRLGQTTASGLVTVQGTGTLNLNLTSLGGRSASTFDFAGTGTSTDYDASAGDYQVTIPSLDLTNAVVGSPVQVSGLVTAFGAAPTDLTASTLLDTTTINAQLVLDWGAGTPSPFASYTSSEITLDARNSSIGARHEIQIGAQTVNIVGIISDPIIEPNATAGNTVFTIGHSTSGTFENFITYAAFFTQLQLELNGTVLATGVTAIGQYSTADYTFSASSITLFLNN